RRRNARRGCGLATRTLDRHVLRRRLPARLRRRRGWRPGLHRVRYRVPQANHRRQKGGRRSAAADPIDEIELLRCSPHADLSLKEDARNGQDQVWSAYTEAWNSWRKFSATVAVVRRYDKFPEDTRDHIVRLLF